ncbi:tRNA pseudouridine(55) synthase TruB [bacterium 1XD42-8]|nr:tRNA pseudouridine(55) synthase TruB [Lachnospiraceae bacterium]RKJ48313.1 tRNA pseudouridine(55) synthase TruB [bacterium 1XD42-8]
MLNGIINVYKEKGYTSHDVVAKLRGILEQKKIGHTGTLDPDAVGVLPVCLGKGTKLCDMLTDQSKTYEAVLFLGVETDTQDMSGKIIEEKEVKVTKKEIEAAIYSFVGAYDQIPPMYSARKVNGKKLYELARAGIEVERKPKRVEISDIQIMDINLPRIWIEVSCSKGTYIRTLCHDIGEKLFTKGAMEELVRTRSGRFQMKDSLTLKEIEKKKKEKTLMDNILPVEEAFSSYPKVNVKEQYDKYIHNGNSFLLNQAALLEEKEEIEGLSFRVYDSKKQFTGIYVYRNGAFKPVKMFL